MTALNDDALIAQLDADRQAVERDAQAIAGLDPDTLDAMDDRALLERIHVDQQRILAFAGKVEELAAPLAQLAGSGMSPMAMLGAMMRGPG